MTINDFLISNLKQSMQLFEWHLADLTDAEMLARPCPGANHATWQIGHLIGSEVSFGNTVKPGSMPELPAGFKDKFSKETAKIDDPKAFPSKAELMALAGKVREASIAWVKAMSTEELQRPTPGEMQSYAPTVQHIASLLPDHMAMHLGQFQVLRRKLGKPLLM